MLLNPIDTSFAALDEGDIALLKTYVSKFTFIYN